MTEELKDVDVKQPGPAPAGVQTTNVNLTSGDDLFERADKIWHLLGQTGQPPAILAKAIGLYKEIDAQAVISHINKQLDPTGVGLSAEEVDSAV